MMANIGGRPSMRRHHAPKPAKKSVQMVIKATWKCFKDMD
jgi:hypothetical protein